MNLKNLLVFVGIFLWVLPSLAQNVTIKGSVKDTKGEPMMGAFVFIKGTQHGTSTDFDGNYTLNAQVGDVLKYSFLGMKSVEKKVTAGVTQIDIVLEDDIQQLEGTVVTGYGSKKIASRTVASVATVKGKDFAETPNANITDALQGKVAGMVVTTESGRPGASSSVLIHGLNTFMSVFDKTIVSEPLYIIDGAPVSGDIMTMYNPTDIESVTVLKDAASVGVRATPKLRQELSPIVSWRQILIIHVGIKFSFAISLLSHAPMCLFREEVILLLITFRWAT